MLKARKRITKRQMKEDKFVTYYFKAVDYLENNSRNLLMGAGAVIVVLFAIFIYQQKQTEKRENAIVALAEAKVDYFNGNFQEAADRLQIIVDSYGGTESATIATFYLADARYSLKEYEFAEALFREYVDRGQDEILLSSASAGIAACLEEQGKVAEAAQAYRDAAETYKDSFQAPEHYFNAARCYSLAGNDSEARQMLEIIIQDYSSSQVKNDAEILLAKLNT